MPRPCRPACPKALPLRYDDRLATVLEQPASDRHGRAVQWRQLVELVARVSNWDDPGLRDRALRRIAQLMDEVPGPVLAATARAIAGPRVPAELVALFAARGSQAAAALVTAAELGPEGWAAVRAVASDDLKPLLPRLAATAPEPRAPEEPPCEPVPPSPAIFRWECGPTGEIDWIEGAPRAAFIGCSISEALDQRFAAHLPFSDEALELGAAPALGEWRWSGQPAFFPEDGRFAGYRGIARREGVTVSEPLAAMPEDDDLRELMHELRTPLNAIIGFSEIIEGQYLGPAHRAYRERAAEIVRHARQLAEVVDNLDLCAKFRSGRFEGETIAAAAVVTGTLAEVAEQVGGDDIHLLLSLRATDARLALPADCLSRLVRQFAQALTAGAAPGERLQAVVDRLGGSLAVSIDRPAALRGLNEEQLIGREGRPGTRLQIRLVQGLAAMVGGRLDIAADRLVLLLPLAP